MGKNYEVMPSKPVRQEITGDLVVLFGQRQSINTPQSFIFEQRTQVGEFSDLR